MPELKLGKLPDRTPVKISFAASPEQPGAPGLCRDLSRDLWPAEAVAEQVSFLLEVFICSDRGFAKARKRYSLGLLSPNRDGPVEWLRRPYCTDCCDLLSGWFDRLGLVSP